MTHKPWPVGKRPECHQCRNFVLMKSARGISTKIFGLVFVLALIDIRWPDEEPFTEPAKVRKQSVQPDSPEEISAESKVANRTRPRIANFLLAGAQKAGTTATADYLFRRRDVCGPIPRPGLSYTRKEAHIFDEEEMMEKGLEHYEGLFSRCTEARIIIDATPKYMLYPENVRRAYEEHGTADSDLKIMFTLREPVQRELSWYSHLLREARSRRPAAWSREVLKNSTGEEKSFVEYMDTVILPSIESSTPTNRGLYAHWLQKWFRLFRRDQILIASYDDFQRNETEFLARLHTFLELPDSVPARKAPKSNNKKVAQDPIPCDVQRRLAEHYKVHNEKLYALLGSHRGPASESFPFTQFRFTCKEE